MKIVYYQLDFKKLQIFKALVVCQRPASTLFPLSASASPLSSTYALPFTPGAALLAPICRDGVSERSKVFLRQPCLGLNLEKPPLARRVIPSNLRDLPYGFPNWNRISAAARSTPTSPGQARRGRGLRWNSESLGVRTILLCWNCSVSSDTRGAQGQ